MSPKLLSYLVSPPSSPSSQAIDHWLDSICGEDIQLHDETSLPCNAQSTSLKRKSGRMEDPSDTTPRPKRRAIGQTTPSLASVSDQGPPPKLLSQHSSQASGSSRSSSPSKRQRDAEITYSKPDVELHLKHGAVRWKAQHGANIPLLKEILASIWAAEKTEDTEMVDVHDFESHADDILEQVEYCQVRKAPEDTWDNLVTYPTLRLARKFAQRCPSIHVVAAKTVQISPKTLLPTNIRRERVQPKRIDYTIGVTFNEAEDVTRRALASIQDHTFNQTTIPLLCDRVLCSHIEIKTERNIDDGRLQLAVWAAAGFQKLENMWLHQVEGQSVPPEMPPFAPIPLWLWKEDILHLYLAIMDSKNERVHIVEEKVYPVDQRASLLKIIRVIAAVMDWGYDHYLPWFKTFTARLDCQ